MVASLSSNGSRNSRRKKKKRASQVLGLRYALWLLVLFCIFCYRFMQSLQMFEDEMNSLQHFSFYDAAWNRDEFDEPIEEISLAYAGEKKESESAFTQATIEGKPSEVTTPAEEMTQQVDPSVSLKITKTGKKRPVPDMTGMDGGVMFYLHVPKTGGTTIRTNFGGWKHGFNEDSVKLGLDYVTGNWREYFNEVVPTVDKYLASKNQGDKRRNTIFIEVHGMDSYTVLELEPILTKWRYLSEKSGVPFFAFTILREALSAQVSFFNEYRIRGDIRFDLLKKKRRRVWEPEEKVAVQKRMVTLAYQDPQCLFMSRGELTFGDYWGKVKVPDKVQEEKEEAKLQQFMEFLRIRPKDKKLRMTRKEFIKMERKVKNRKINDKLHAQIIAHLHKHIYGTHIDTEEKEDDAETPSLHPQDDADKTEEDDTGNDQKGVDGDNDEDTDGDSNGEDDGAEEDTEGAVDQEVDEDNDEETGDGNGEDDGVEDTEGDEDHDVTSLLKEGDSNQEGQDGEAERRRLSEEELLKSRSIASLATGINQDRAKRIEAFKEKYARKKDQEREAEQPNSIRANRQNLKALAQEKRKEKARLAKMRENLSREECRKVYNSLETTFDWIGVTDKLNSETFPLVTKILFGKPIPLHRQRGSDKMLNQLRLEEVTEEVLERLKEKSSSDQELYESASRDYKLDMWEGSEELVIQKKENSAA